MLSIEVLTLKIIFSIWATHGFPLNKDHSTVNRQILLPTELLNFYGPKLENQTVEVIPDIAITNDLYQKYKLGLNWNKLMERKWPNQRIPYMISPLYDTSDIITINSAIRIINQLSCLKFIPQDGSYEDFLIIWPVKFPYGCWSFIGRNGGMQILSLSTADGKGNDCLDNEGKALHEFMHAAGIFHEQSRADRDNYVDIIYDNIIPEYKSNFEKQSIENTTYKFEYDYSSIMHYGWNYFAKNLSMPTIWPKVPVKYFGQRIGLSQLDCIKLNDLYGCLDDKRMAQKYFKRCQVLALQD